MPEKLLTPKELSDLLSVPVSVLAQWRCAGTGVPFVKIGTKHVRYRQKDVDAYLARNSMSSTRRRAESESTT